MGLLRFLGTHVVLANGTIVLVLVVVLVLEKVLFLPTAMNDRGPILETAQTFGAIERN